MPCVALTLLVGRIFGHFFVYSVLKYSQNMIVRTLGAKEVKVVSLTGGTFQLSIKNCV